MTSSPLQCLFCQHLNPADASFCNRCASQLDLQPCMQCSAVDNRNASRCYKCGAAFTHLKGALQPVRRDTEATPALRFPAYEPFAQKELITLIATQSKKGSTGMRRTWGVVVSVLVLAAIALLTYNLMGLSIPATRPSAVRQTQNAAAQAPKETPRANGTVLNSVQTPAPPVADMVITQRLAAAPIAKIQPQRAHPVAKECPPAVAALGLCNPGNPKE